MPNNVLQVVVEAPRQKSLQYSFQVALHVGLKRVERAICRAATLLLRRGLFDPTFVLAKLELNRVGILRIINEDTTVIEVVEGCTGKLVCNMKGAGTGGEEAGVYFITSVATRE